MHELNRDSRRETRYSRYSRYSRYADVFFQRLSALSYREWYVEDGYEDKAYSMRELSISRGIPLHSLYLPTGTFYDTAIIAMQYPSTFFSLLNHFQPLRGRSFFPRKRGRIVSL